MQTEEGECMLENSNPLEESLSADVETPKQPSVPQVVSQGSRELTPQVISIMTTEHYNLQSGRAMTISDSNGRASLFLGTVSTSLVALAFVGGISRIGAG